MNLFALAFLFCMTTFSNMTMASEAPVTPPAPRYLYLTIDDGPLGGVLEILEIEDRLGVPLTMMIVGKHVEASENGREALDKAEKDPLVCIGNHSFSHANDHYIRYYSDPQAVLKDFEKNQRLLGISWKGARLPGRNMWEVGSRSKYDIKSGQTSAQLLKKNGYTVFGWDLEWTHDPKTGEPIESVEFLIEEIEEKVKKSFTPGHVVVLAHDEMFKTAKEGAKLSLLLNGLKEKGYILRTLKDYPIR